MDYQWLFLNFVVVIVNVDGVVWIKGLGRVVIYVIVLGDVLNDDEVGYYCWVFICLCFVIYCWFCCYFFICGVEDIVYMLFFLSFSVCRQKQGY